MKNFYIFLIVVALSSSGFAQTDVTSGVQPTGSIASTIVTQNNAVNIFQFTIEDDVTVPGGTNVSTIRLKPNTPTNTADWSDTIGGVRLSRAGSPGIEFVPSSVTITDNFIELSFSSPGITVANGATETINVGVYLTTDGNVVEGSVLSFRIADDNTVVPIGFEGFAGTTFLSDFSGASDINGTSFPIIVNFTQLSFLQQLSDVDVNTLVSPAITVGFTDIYGNVDTNFAFNNFVFEILANSSALSLISSRVANTLNGVAIFNNLYFTEVTNGVTLTARLQVNPALNTTSNTFNVIASSASKPYVYDEDNGGWQAIPGDPGAITNPDGESSSADTIEIISGDVLLTDPNNFIGSVVVRAGASLTIDNSSKLTVIDNMTLESSSANYSSFIFNGIEPTLGTAVGGQIRYKRWVNAGATAMTPGNDLISPPIKVTNWTTFLNTGTNRDDLISNGTNTLFAFAPFAKGTGTYQNHTNFTGTLTRGRGYRVGTDASTTLTFAGDIERGDISSGVSVAAANIPYYEWNLIGNPYPSYISLADFLAYDPGSGTNLSKLVTGTAVYGYQGDPSLGWLTFTNANGVLIAPGQGFFIRAGGSFGSTVTNGLVFSEGMRRTASNTDDFINGRSANSDYTFLKLNASSATKTYRTEFYFNENSTLGLDHGYDGKMLGNPPSFSLYSHLVQDNDDEPVALQSLHTTDLINTTIALGVNCNQGEQLNFSIFESTLPDSVDVYLEDNETNTVTLLNTGDYNLTTTEALSGTGRFFLRFEDNSSLSTGENILNDLNIYVNQNLKEIVINGQLLKAATASIYDIQGRLVLNEDLVSSQQSQTINVQNLSAGVYVVQLQNGTQTKTQKVILR